MQQALIERVAGDRCLVRRRKLPLGLRRQPRIGPAREGIRFIQADMTYRPMGVDRPNAAERKFGIQIFRPVERAVPALSLNAGPSIREPQLRVTIAPIVDEGPILAVGHEAIAELVVLDEHVVPRRFVIEAESIARVPDPEAP